MWYAIKSSLCIIISSIILDKIVTIENTTCFIGKKKKISISKRVYSILIRVPYFVSKIFLFPNAQYFWTIFGSQLKNENTGFVFSSDHQGHINTDIFSFKHTFYISYVAFRLSYNFWFLITLRKYFKILKHYFTKIWPFGNHILHHNIT